MPDSVELRFLRITSLSFFATCSLNLSSISQVFATALLSSCVGLELIYLHSLTLSLSLKYRLLRTHPYCKMQAVSSVGSLLLFASVTLGAPAPAPQASYYSAPATLESAAPAPSTVPVTDVSSHGPFEGTPTTTGALTTTFLAASIPALPPNPTATTYPSDGQLHDPEPAPYAPAGGLGTNGTEPVYKPQSDFDYESLAVALYQEWIELDLFNFGLASFSTEDFEAAGLNAEDRELIRFMAQQEIGHATLLTNILGAEAPVQCAYNYPFTTVREFVDFCQKLTRFGESGV